MSFKTGTGSSFAIGTTLATPNGTQAEYEADSYTTVSEVESVGEFGDAREIVATSRAVDSLSSADVETDDIVSQESQTARPVVSKDAPSKDDLKNAITAAGDKKPIDRVDSQATPTQVAALPTGGDKSGVTSQAISMPKGSGTVQGMGESFSAQLSTGIATFSVPFSLLPARGRGHAEGATSDVAGGRVQRAAGAHGSEREPVVLGAGCGHAAVSFPQWLLHRSSRA